MPHLPIPSPETLQDRIIEEFHTLAEEREMMLHYLIELGERLPPLDPIHKTEENRIQGCMSTVWLRSIHIDNKLFLEADSNTAITKGLISLLLRIWSGQPITAILTTKLYFIEQIGIAHLIGAQRSSGLAQMIQQIQHIAIRTQATNR